MCDAGMQIICTVHTNVPKKYGRMYGTDKTGHHLCLSKIKQKLEKAIHEKKESKHQKTNNKTVSCDAEHHREELLQLFK